MSYCLWCDRRVENGVSWQDVFGLSRHSLVCLGCKEELETLSPPLCRICGRSLPQMENVYKKNGFCYDCIRWEEGEWGGLLRKNRSLYEYNAFLKEKMSLFKFRGDVEVIKGLADEWRTLYEKEFNGFPVIPIPLSVRRLYERGFNQSAELGHLLPAPFYDLLERIVHEEKQSKKSRNERLAFNQSNDLFRLRDFPNELKGKQVILIDDIYTTGATLRRAAKVLLNGGAASVNALTIARG